MGVSTTGGVETGECVALVSGLVWGIFMGFGRDMPKPGPILSDQCLIFANLFMLSVVMLCFVERVSSRALRK